MKIIKTKRTKIARTPKRASYDRELLNKIIDEAIVGHLAFANNLGVHSVPMSFWRDQDYIHCHCSNKSRLASLAQNRSDVCISFAIFDGLVLAKSAFRHGMNYRSAIVYGKPELVEDEGEKLHLLKKFMDSFDTKRWDMVRAPSPKELNVTAILKISLAEASVKVRQGPPIEEKTDLQRDIWSGVMPRNHSYGEPELQ